MEKWCFVLITQILWLMSDEIREVLVRTVLDLDNQAKSTDNPWDDIFTGMIKNILNDGLSGKKKKGV